MTGYIIASVLVALSFLCVAPVLVARRRALAGARRQLVTERQRQLDARRYHERLAEVTSWEPPDLDAMAEAARKAAAELEHEPQPGTNVAPPPGSLTHRPDLALAFMESATDEQLAEVAKTLAEANRQRFTYESGIRMAERARKVPRTTSRSVTVHGSAENSIIVTGDGNKVGMRWSETGDMSSAQRRAARKFLVDEVSHADPDIIEWRYR